MIYEDKYIYRHEKLFLLASGCITILLGIMGVMGLFWGIYNLGVGSFIFVLMCIIVVFIGIQLTSLGFRRQRIKITEEGIYPRYKTKGKELIPWKDVKLFVEIYYKDLFLKHIKYKLDEIYVLAVAPKRDMTSLLNTLSPGRFKLIVLSPDVLEGYIRNRKKIPHEIESVLIKNPLQKGAALEKLYQRRGIDVRDIKPVSE